MAFNFKLSGQKGLKWRLLPVVKFVFMAAGKGWNEFYGWMIDRLERRNTIERILAAAAKRAGASADTVKGLYDVRFADRHLKLLRDQGLKPEHKLLDFGCGYGRSAIPIIRFLDSGNYIGVDLSKERIRLAGEYVRHEGLEGKSPQFHVCKDNSIPVVAAGSIDMIWSSAVMAHVPHSEMESVFKGFHRVLKPGGTAVFDHDTEDEKTDAQTIKDFLHPVSFIDSVAKQIGFDIVEVDSPVPDQAGRTKFDPELKSRPRWVKITKH